MGQLRAHVTEIFSSVQGEGIFAGAKQIFIRFRNCNLECGFCDEAHKKDAKEYATGELMAEVREIVRQKGAHHSVSLTGGEPLLHTSFLKELLPLLKAEGHKIYLETNGTLPAQLREVIDMVDIIAMDFKLPSSTGERAFWNEHQEFLRAAFQKRVFVKVVVTPDTDQADILKASELIRSVNKKIPFIIQPATPVKKDDETVKKSRLVELLDLVSSSGVECAEILPQMHKIWGLK